MALRVFFIVVGILASCSDGARLGNNGQGSTKRTSGNSSGPQCPPPTNSSWDSRNECVMCKGNACVDNAPSEVLEYLEKCYNLDRERWARANADFSIMVSTLEAIGEDQAQGKCMKLPDLPMSYVPGLGWKSALTYLGNCFLVRAAQHCEQQCVTTSGAAFATAVDALKDLQNSLPGLIQEFMQCAERIDGIDVSNTLEGEGEGEDGDENEEEEEGDGEEDTGDGTEN